MKRFGDRTGVSSLLQDESDGALSAPEMPSIRRDRGKIDVHVTIEIFMFACLQHLLENIYLTKIVQRQVNVIVNKLLTKKALNHSYIRTRKIVIVLYVLEQNTNWFSYTTSYTNEFKIISFGFCFNFFILFFCMLR